MKNIIAALKDPYIQKTLLFISLQTIATIGITQACIAEGVQQGADAVITLAEKMNPGFTEQFQKFVMSHKYGLKQG